MQPNETVLSHLLCEITMKHVREQKEFKELYTLLHFNLYSTEEKSDGKTKTFYGWLNPELSHIYLMLPP